MRQQLQQLILSGVPPGMPHRPSSARLLSSNLSSTLPSEDTLYTSCLQALPLAARTSRLPCVARAHQQRPGQECDANAEGAVGRPSWRARRETAARGVVSSRASLPDSGVAKRRWKRARCIVRTVVDGMRGGHRSQSCARGAHCSSYSMDGRWRWAGEAER